MEILKWYSSILMIFSYLVNIYHYGKESEILGFIISSALEIPLIIYLILS